MLHVCFTLVSLQNNETKNCAGTGLVIREIITWYRFVFFPHCWTQLRYTCVQTVGIHFPDNDTTSNTKHPHLTGCVKGSFHLYICDSDFTLIWQHFAWCQTELYTCYTVSYLVDLNVWTQATQNVLSPLKTTRCIFVLHLRIILHC